VRVIDAATAEAFARVERRAADARAGFMAGFEPHATDVAEARPASRAVPDAGPLNAVAPDGAYFVVTLPNGRRAYTRDGTLGVRDDRIVLPDGAAVLGVSPGSTSLAPLRVDTIERALGRVRDLHVEPDGSLVYERTTVDPRTATPRAERTCIGRVALARFPSGTAPVRVDETHLTAPQGVAPHVGLPGDGTFAPLRPHARDRGRVDPARGLERLHEAYVSLDALLAARRARVDLERTTMDLLK
jgi:hypothetical protein